MAMVRKPPGCLHLICLDMVPQTESSHVALFSSCHPIASAESRSMPVVKLLTVLFVGIRFCAGKLAESVQHDSGGSSECKI